MQKKTVRIPFRQLFQFDIHPAVQKSGHILTCFHFHETGPAGRRPQMHFIPGDRKSAFHLGTDGDEVRLVFQALHQFREKIGCPVVPVFESQQTRTDTDFQLLHCGSLSMRRPTVRKIQRARKKIKCFSGKPSG